MRSDCLRTTSASHMMFKRTPRHSYGNVYILSEQSASFFFCKTIPREPLLKEKAPRIKGDHNISSRFVRVEEKKYHNCDN